MARQGSKLVIKRNTISPNLATIRRKWPKAGEDVLVEEAKRVEILTSPFVPRDKGTLADSFFIRKARRKGEKISVEFGYGNDSDAALYAAAQHEGPGSEFAPPSWSGKTRLSYTTPGTGTKFLDKGLALLSATHERRLKTLLSGRIKQILLKK